MKRETTTKPDWTDIQLLVLTYLAENPDAANDLYVFRSLVPTCLDYLVAVDSSQPVSGDVIVLYIDVEDVPNFRDFATYILQVRDAELEFAVVFQRPQS